MKASYHASPPNWRVSLFPDCLNLSKSTYLFAFSPFQALPCYTLLLDKWYDGIPGNNDFFKTQFEWDLTETQLRYGGDAKGLMNSRSLDYLQGMGVKSLYIAGTPWLNMPWQADSASGRSPWKIECVLTFSAGRSRLFGH